jgi:hypothetical protein
MNQKIEQELKRTANRTWEYIAGDILQCSAECDPDFSGSIPKAEVVDCVADHFYSQMTNLSPEAKEVWEAMDWKERAALLEKAFTFQSYGW